MIPISSPLSSIPSSTSPSAEASSSYPKPPIIHFPPPLKITRMPSLPATALMISSPRAHHCKPITPARSFGRNRRSPSRLGEDQGITEAC
ncbi:hypothetical protein C1H46_030587 [Malus baccata]|uniref:Uncharacterized protein n=1 Tax=Malus baccata TaxID=106549 RepID=A0A540LBI4_MALBA|nr:hypothetical protein C1H46_030587 [Malus baccata]